MNIMKNELIQKLFIDKTLISKLEALDEVKIQSIAEKCNKNGFNCLLASSDIERLAVCLCYSEKYTKQFYKDNNIPLNIYYDTMKDIAIWCENNNNSGLKNYNWITNHLKGELFAIGRLQYQLYTCKNKTLNYDFLPFNYGEKLIYVHIPQGEKLVYSSCVESLKDARAFFEQYFPNFEYKFFFCESWLLFDENYMFMKPSSNILQFQSLFDIVYCEKDDSQAIERIFGKKRLLLSSYPTKTSLQKSAVEYMKAKNKLGVGIGIIDKNDI